MPAYNRVIIMGNLTRDPELRYLPNNTPVTEIGVAINEKFKNKQTGQTEERVHYVDCVAFSKTAENLNKFFTKGKPIMVEGRLRFEQWEDKQTGQKRSKLKVVVDQWQFAGDSKQQGGQQQARGQDTGHQPVQADEIPF